MKAVKANAVCIMEYLLNHGATFEVTFCDISNKLGLSHWCPPVGPMDRQLFNSTVDPIEPQGNSYFLAIQDSQGVFHRCCGFQR